MDDIYYRYSDYLKKTYGERVYKLSLNIPATCPNRINGGGGCTYCGGVGAGFENLPNAFSVREQLDINMEYIGKRYGCRKFISYFQNFTNTYMPLDTFRECMEAAVKEGIVELAVATRPDCVSRQYLDILKEISQKNGLNITLEFGLQSANYHSLIRVNRGHTLAEFIDAVLLAKEYGFSCCTHMILNLPWDGMDDVIEGAKLLSAMRVDFVKLHALYIEKNTVMAKQFETGLLELTSIEEYMERVIEFLRRLSPDIAVQRIVGRAPEGNTIFANWSASWWKIRDDIEAIMRERGVRQGDLFNYLGGSAVKRFLDNS